MALVIPKQLELNTTGAAVGFIGGFISLLYRLRLELEYQEIITYLKRGDYATLSKVDQLRREKDSCKVFNGFSKFITVPCAITNYFSFSFRITGCFRWKVSTFLTKVVKSVKSSPVATGGFGGLSPHKQPSPPNWNMKHYKQSFCSEVPCTNVNPPYWRLSGDGSG